MTTPTDIFSARRVTRAYELTPLAPVFSGARAVERVYLLAPPSRGEAIADSLKIELDKHGAYIPFDSGVDLRGIAPSLLPFFARPELTPFLSDLAPANSWGCSLGALLVGRSVRPLSDASDRKFGGKCYMCGSPRWTDKAPAHHPRTWWSFKAPRAGEPFGRQHLLSLTPMCNECEDMFHIGPDSDAGRLKASLLRLAGAFRYTESECRHYSDLVNARRDGHSRCMWAVDGSRVFGEAPVLIQAAWQHRGEPGITHPILYRPNNGKGHAASLLLYGVRYQVAESHRVHFHQ